MAESHATLDDAVSCIETAIALGLPVPMPVGSEVYEALVYLEAASPVSLGYYQTEADATLAVRNWVVLDWMVTGFCPWSGAHRPSGMNVEQYDEFLTEWLKEHTDEETINVYLDHNNDTWDVKRITAKMSPTRLVPNTSP